MHDFALRLIAWQRRHGRHDLPWQRGADAYAVWVSEIMLQQTQVDTVIPYYRRFLDRFPDLPALAGARLEEVLALWSGLGYYARARNLHAAARRVVERHGGVFPRRFEDILELPGVGRSTAAAIAALAHGERQAILDGNVRRVLCRLFGVEGWPGDKAVEDRLWRLAESLLPERDVGVYTQGLMDLGATLCTRNRPRCEVCPFAADCVAARAGRQSELPSPRPRKALPKRTTAMLILCHGREVLLERRPPAGIWGGLWSLPECAADEDVLQAAGRLGCRSDAARALPTLRHSFTHFRLEIRPWLLSVQRHSGVTEAGGRLWVGFEEAMRAAVPTPVRRLLTGLAGGGGA
jgi:A/G-specific adenine glycosylase